MRISLLHILLTSLLLAVVQSHAVAAEEDPASDEAAIQLAAELQAEAERSGDALMDRMHRELVLELNRATAARLALFERPRAAAPASPASAAPTRESRMSCVTIAPGRDECVVLASRH